MLEKPDLTDERICACLFADFGLSVSQIDFLPLGADQNTAVYRAMTAVGKTYFVKLRSGNFNGISVELPKFLYDQGIRQIIVPQESMAGCLWADLDRYKLILYPFVDGQNGYGTSLSNQQWCDFGAAMRQVHGTVLPKALAERIPQEAYSAQYRQSVRKFLERAHVEDYTDPTSIRLAVFLREKRDSILDLVRQAERLALTLQIRPSEQVLCHSDLHAGNILVDAEGGFYIVDWDDPIFAPKERDLMFIGGGQGFVGYSTEEEESLFYRGYGSVQVDPTALAYYRCERIVVDIALFCAQILSPDGGDEDRMQALRYLMSNFHPGGTIEITCESDNSR